MQTNIFHKRTGRKSADRTERNATKSSQILFTFLTPTIEHVHLERTLYCVRGGGKREREILLSLQAGGLFSANSSFCHFRRALIAEVLVLTVFAEGRGFLAKNRKQPFPRSMRREQNTNITGEVLLEKSEKRVMKEMRCKNIFLKTCPARTDLICT